MLATYVTADWKSENGPRPIRLGQDVRQVLHLLDVVFGPILDSQGRRILHSTLSLHYQVPFLLRLNQMTTGFNPGFVWESDGQIVGNVSLIETRVPGRYLIANVAVHPDYRRRGIARGMMQAAIKHVQERNGRTVALQVQQDNDGAITLYRQLQFDVIGDLHTWEASYSRIGRLPVARGSAPALRPLRRREWQAAYALDRASFNPGLVWPRPIPPDFYKTGLWRWLDDFFNGRRSEIWVTAPADKKPLNGLAAIHSEWGRPHMLSLRVHPEWRGQLERPLLAKLLRRLRYLRHHPVHMSHLADDEITNQLLTEANFQVKRTLTVMELALNS